MPPQQRYAMLRSGNPYVDLMRLGAELSAIRELHGTRVIEKRGTPVYDPRTFHRLRASAETAKHFDVYMECLKRPKLLGKALTAQQVLMALMVRDLGYSQEEVADWFGTNQPAVSRLIRAAEAVHGDDLNFIRGKIATAVGI